MGPCKDATVFDLVDLAGFCTTGLVLFTKRLTYEFEIGFFDVSVLSEDNAPLVGCDTAMGSSIKSEGLVLVSSDSPIDSRAALSF